MKKPQRYKTPPIEEALVEFHMVSRGEWDLTIPGKLHEKVKEAYPQSRAQNLVHASLQQSEGSPAGLVLQSQFARVQLISEDAKRLISLGPNTLSVNVLKPYDGWDKFKQRILEALQSYSEVAHVSEVLRIGVRYINRIVIQNEDTDTREYFTCAPEDLTAVSSKVAGFINRTEYSKDERTRIIVTFASVESEPNSKAFLLDLDVIWDGTNTQSLSIQEALEKVEELHSLEGTSFEALITDKVREVLNA